MPETKDGRTKQERAELGKRINARRTQMRLTCVALADKCDLRNAKAVHNIESGRRCVTELELDRIAEALQCSTNYLLTGEEDSVTEPIPGGRRPELSFSKDENGTLVIKAKRRRSVKPVYVMLTSETSYTVRELAEKSGWSITDLVNELLVFGIDHLKIKGGTEHD